MHMHRQVENTAVQGRSSIAMECRSTLLRRWGRDQFNRPLQAPHICGDGSGGPQLAERKDGPSAFPKSESNVQKRLLMLQVRALVSGEIRPQSSSCVKITSFS